MFPAFASLTKLDLDKIERRQINPRVRDSMLMGGQVDAVTGFDTTVFFNLKNNGVKYEDVNIIYYGDHGLDVYGNAILASRAALQDKRELVKRFVAASARGWREIDCRSRGHHRGHAQVQRSGAVRQRDRAPEVDRRPDHRARDDQQAGHRRSSTAIASRSTSSRSPPPSVCRERWRWMKSMTKASCRRWISASSSESCRGRPARSSQTRAGAGCSHENKSPDRPARALKENILWSRTAIMAEPDQIT